MNDVRSWTRAQRQDVASRGRAFTKRARRWLEGPWGVALVPALTTLVITSLGAGDRQLWHDELATWWAATLSLSDLVALLRHVDAVLAPYYVFMHGWIMVFGDSAFALRLPSVLCAAAAGGLTALLGRRLFGAPTGILAGLIFAVLPSVSRYAAEARPYAASMLATVLATLLLIAALDRPSTRRWVLYGASIALVGLTHVVALLVLPAHGVLALRGTAATSATAIWLKRASAARPWLLATLAGLLLVVPIVYAGSTQTQQLAWINGGWHVALVLPGALMGATGVALVVIGLALVGIARRGWQMVLLAVWAVVPPVATFLAFDLVKLFLPRYLLMRRPFPRGDGAIGRPAAPDAVSSPVLIEEGSTAPELGQPPGRRWKGSPAASREHTIRQQADTDWAS